jgi:hypothetical protein
MKNYLLILITLIFAISFNTVIAQETVNYEILHNNPNEDISNLKMRLNIGGDLNSLTYMYLNAGIEGEAILKNKIGLTYNIDHSFFTMANVSATKSKTSISAHTYELGGLFYFKDNTYEKNQKVVLKLSTKSRSEGSTTYTSTTTTFVTVPNANIRYLIGARAGLYLYGAPLNTKKIIDKSLSENYASSDWSHYNVSGIYVGLIRSRISSLLIKTNNYGECGNKGFENKLYADILFAPIFSATSSSTETDAILKSNSKKIPIGIRIGLINTPCGNKEKGLTFKAEIGYRPGIGSLYCSFAIGIRLLNKNIKPLN